MLMRHFTWRALIGAGLFWSLSACGPERPSPTGDVPSVAEMATFEVAPVEIPDVRVVAALVTNRDTGDARARIGGRISRILVREGDAVRKGQTIAVISDERIRLEADAGAAAVEAARASAEQARTELERAQRLFERGVYATARIEAVRAASEAADARLKAAIAQAGAVDALNDQGRVIASADGRVTRIPVPEGAVVMPGEVVVALATGIRVLRVTLPEGEAAALQEGALIRIRPGQAGASAEARIVQVYPSVSGGRVMADLDASAVTDGLIGERILVEAPTGVRTTIVIPRALVRTRYGADYVRLVRPGGAVLDAPVQIGGEAPLADGGGGVEVLSGLRAGDRLVAHDLGGSAS
jgi:RND family efflux transporter MFP subunit